MEHLTTNKSRKRDTKQRRNRTIINRRRRRNQLNEESCQCKKRIRKPKKKRALDKIKKLEYNIVIVTS